MADERGNGLRVSFVRGLDRPCRATADCTTLSSSLSAGAHLSVSSINHALRRWANTKGRDPSRCCFATSEPGQRRELGVI
jgi:hypothetical protein